jgi:hypothetical protein
MDAAAVLLSLENMICMNHKFGRRIVMDYRTYEE